MGNPALLIPAIAQAGIGAYQLIKSTQAMNKLLKQGRREYTEAMAPYRENYDLYRQQYVGGMGPGSLNLARQQFATQQAGLLRAPASGQLRDQLGRVAAANTGQFGLNLAAQNENIRRAGLSGMAGANQAISALQQREIAQDISDYNRQMAEYGQAQNIAVNNIFGAISGAATGYLGQQNLAAQRDLYRDIYGAGKQVPSTMPSYSVPPPNTFIGQDAYYNTSTPGFDPNNLNPSIPDPYGLRTGRMTTPSIYFSNPRQ